MTCVDCKFSDPAIWENGMGMECKRFPPVLFVVDNEVTRGFPQVNADDWCGEFKPKED